MANITQEGEDMRETYQDLEKQALEDAYSEARHQVFVEELIQLAYNTPNDTLLGLKVRSVLQKYNIHE